FVRGGTIVKRYLGLDVGPKTAARWLMLTNNLGFVTDSGPLPRGLDTREYQLDRNGKTTVNGHRAESYSNGRLTLTITSSRPYRLLRIQTAPAYSYGGVTALRLDPSDYGAPVKETLPADAIDADDGATW